MSATPPSPDVNTTSNDVTSSRGAIDNTIDNSIDNIREEQALTIDLINEMKSKYPNKDIDSTLSKMLNYYKNKDVPLDFKFRQWCERERVETGAVSDFKYDSTGKFRLGYCGVCGESASYTDNELNGDSKCKKRCRATVMPDKEGLIRVVL